MTTPAPADDRDHDLNPHRDADQQHAADLAAHALRQRGVAVEGTEDSDEMAAVLDAVETFENARALRGADSFTNQLDSVDPDDEKFVLPERAGDESLRGYAHRVRQAAARIMSPKNSDRRIDDPGDLGGDPDLAI